MIKINNLLEKEMIRQVIEHHRIGRVHRVRLGQHLDAHAIRFGFVQVELGNCQSDQCANALWIQFEGAFEGQSKKKRNSHKTFD